MLKNMLLLLVLATGCGEEVVPPDRDPPEEEWVCYNPESEYHGHACSEDCYWLGLERVQNSFCWLLTRDDCSGPIEYEWQRENCHLLGIENK